MPPGTGYGFRLNYAAIVSGLHHTCPSKQITRSDIVCGFFGSGICETDMLPLTSGHSVSRIHFRMRSLKLFLKGNYSRTP